MLKKMLMVVIAGAFCASIATAADEVRINETWNVSVHWYNPEIVGDYDMVVNINDSTWPLVGDIDTGTYQGTITVNRNPRSVAWDIAQIAFYDGMWSNRTNAAGTMENPGNQNYGDWTARKVGADEVVFLDAPAELTVGAK